MSEELATAFGAEAEDKGRNKPGRASPTYTQPGLMSPPGLRRSRRGPGWQKTWQVPCCGELLRLHRVAQGRCCRCTSLQGPGREALLPAESQLLLLTKLNRGLPWWSRGCESCVPMQGTWDRCLIWEDPMCCRAQLSRHHNH